MRLELFSSFYVSYAQNLILVLFITSMIPVIVSGKIKADEIHWINGLKLISLCNSIQVGLFIYGLIILNMSYLSQICIQCFFIQERREEEM